MNFPNNRTSKLWVAGSIPAGDTNVFNRLCLVISVWFSACTNRGTNSITVGAISTAPTAFCDAEAARLLLNMPTRVVRLRRRELNSAPNHLGYSGLRI